MKVLVACEFSGIVREAFRSKGHDVWSCDILDTEIPGNHLKDDIFNVLWYNHGWDLLIAHPPCTYLTNAGVRHLHDHVQSKKGNKAKVSGVARWKALEEAGKFFQKLLIAPVNRICIENPIPHKYAKEYIGQYTQIIQPWQFGHGETKATCLWLQNLPKLTPTNIVEGREHRIHNMSPGPNRAKERSRTFQGIADAMAEQWGTV